MSEDEDIIKIRKILQSQNRKDLADLLKVSRSRLDKSSTFGRYHYSVLSTFNIFSPLKQNEELKKLSEEDKDEIFSAILTIYPHGDESPEIRNIKYCIDFDLDDINLVETTNLERIDFDYIHKQIEKCENKIAGEDYEGAITNSRTLIESICLFIYEKSKGEEYEYDGNLLKLHKEVRQILKMEPANGEDECLKQILSGIISIITGVSALRNSFSDAHGRSPEKTYVIDKRHALLSINLAKTVSEYLFLSYEKLEQNKKENKQ